MSISALPVELHRYICELGCTDNGTFARSVGRLSHYFRRVVGPFAYQSIALHGSRQIYAFARILEREELSCSRVKHLVLCADAEAENDAVFDWTDIIRVIHATASTLQTFCFRTDDPTISTSCMAHIYRTSFPQLINLTLIGLYPFPSSRPTPSFPQLKHLRLHGNRNPHGLFLAEGLDSACPELTHLWVSGLQMALSFVTGVKTIVEGERGRGDVHSCFPPKLRHLVLQPGAPPLALPVHSEPRRRVSNTLATRNHQGMLSALTVLDSMSTGLVSITALPGTINEAMDTTPNFLLYDTATVWNST